MTLPYRSFWMGGYEGADHLNGSGVPLDMVKTTGHIDRLDEDFAAAAALGLETVRESIGWRLAEGRPGQFDLSRPLRIAAAAQRHGLQVIWTLMHYGTPADVDLRSDALIDRFARYAGAVAEALAPLSPQPPVYNLINEVGFLAWAASATRLIHPYGHGGVEGEGDSRNAGYEVKRRLVRAVLAGRQAVLRVDPRARFLHVEPLVHVVAPPGRPELANLARQVAGYQWQVWDLIAGRLEPALGGDPEALDLLGVNHYHSGQWEVETESRLHWHRRDGRRVPFSRLLGAAWQRYGRPMIVAETSHVGEGRVEWLHEMAAEVARARRGVPVQGLCLYPLIDRPDWDGADHWHRSGLWDVDLPAAAGSGAPPLARTLHADYASALAQWQAHLPHLPQPPHAVPAEAEAPVLLVFSHLRWDFVYQRPQQLMSRLAARHRVVFVEEPVHCDGPARLDRMPRGPRIDVLVPRLPSTAPGFHDDHLAMLQPLLAAWLQAEGIDDFIAWFYTPMALPLIDGLQPRAAVYDCMDELAAFKNAPRQLRQREHALMKRAGLVLTRGPSLYAARQGLHPRLHCVPSGVDAAHFSPSTLDTRGSHAIEAASLQSGWARPRLGFFGVIDERMDLALLEALATARPAWQIVMVGPVTKIDPAALPRHGNLHWLGLRPHGLLPHLMAGWDVCLMPFAANESTRFINPTKTLEYLAGVKPVVATAVADVVSLFGSVLRIVHDAAGFIAACDAALQETPAERARRVDATRQIVSQHAWDDRAATVAGLIAALPLTSPEPLDAGDRAIDDLPHSVVAG